MTILIKNEGSFLRGPVSVLRSDITDRAMLPLCLLCVVPGLFCQHYQEVEEDTTQLLLSDLAFLDQDIAAVFSELPGQVATARLSLAASRATANRFSLSYGIAVALGTLVTIDVRIVVVVVVN